MRLVEKREVVEIVGNSSSTSTRRSGRLREDGGSTGAPCGACKFLRRKCINGCIFAPYFGSDQGAARFAAVHKVFGASNVSKLLLHIPPHRRHEAVVTVCYEAQARLSDPVYGCVSTIFALQQQVAALQTELSLVQTQLINSRIAAANALHHHQQQQQQQQMGVLQPATHHVYANNSSVATNMTIPGSSLSMGPYSRVGMKDDSSSDPAACSFHGMHYELEMSPTMDNMSSPRHFQTLQMTPSSQEDQTDDPVELQAFARSLLQRK
ncbi:hypothetical protein SUGI_0645950 [Cryptomeria japonica]|nr:hypothetical protein SUGI_0645950 [Cryptomeria japonica]